MPQLHSSHGKLARTSSELKIFLEHEAEARIFFCFLGEAKDIDKVWSFECSKKLFFLPGGSEKSTIVLVNAIKTIEFKYRIYSNKHRRPDTIKIKIC